MFIHTEATPNPDALKFLPGCTILGDTTMDFSDPASAQHVPLVQRLFEIQGVKSVFLGSNFMTISKSQGYEWESLQIEILTCLMEFFLLGCPVVLRDTGGEGGDSYVDAEQSIVYSEEDRDTVKQIKEILDTTVRPWIKRDGGDVSFGSFERGVVYVVMRGACTGCPSSEITLKLRIENLLRHYIPAVTEVRQMRSLP